MQMELILFGMVLPWILLAVCCWLGFQLLRQGGRILLRLEELEKRVPGAKAPPAPAALPLGTPAPEFELPDLQGTGHSLAELRGKNLLLIFSSPKCGYCLQMLPDLAKIPADGQDGRPIPVLVTNGTVAENQELVRAAGLQCLVLLQKGMEIAGKYQVQGTPMGYLIDGKGAIASPVVVGGPPLMELAQASSDDQKGAAKAVPGKENKGLAHSQLKRDGLSAGTPAPLFSLPAVAGGEIALEHFRGRRVLLIFSDPQCGPCDQVAPSLEEIHRRRQDLQVLMVSRRDLERNRRKVAALGLTFPVALQKQWEVSRLYAIFATPIAYLIDEEGVLVKDVAVGVEGILALASAAPQLSPSVN